MVEERKPLLSIEPDIDELIKDLSWQESRAELAANAVNDWYQTMISEGKLRVVEAVELRPNNYDANLDCSSCGWSVCYIHIEAITNEDEAPFNCCPGCGNPIKKV